MCWQQNYATLENTDETETVENSLSLLTTESVALQCVREQPEETVSGGIMITYTKWSCFSWIKFWSPGHSFSGNNTREPGVMAVDSICSPEYEQCLLALNCRFHSILTVSCVLCPDIETAGLGATINHLSASQTKDLLRCLTDKHITGNTRTCSESWQGVPYTYMAGHHTVILLLSRPLMLTRLLNSSMKLRSVTASTCIKDFYYCE